MNYLDISDASITASSERNANHSAKQVRMNLYIDDMWSAHPRDRAPWVQFDMEQEVTVWGVTVKPRYDGDGPTNQGVTKLQVAMSKERLKWRDVSEVITISHSAEQISIVRFDESATAQYWIIKVLAWKNEASMKADLIGQPAGRRRLFSLMANITYVTVYCFSI